MSFLKACLLLFRAMLVSRSTLVIENLALRQQLAVYKQSVKRPKLRPRNRIFWICMYRLWPNWRFLLAIVQPETVIRWQRCGHARENEHPQVGDLLYGRARSYRAVFTIRENTVVVLTIRHTARRDLKPVDVDAQN